MHDKQTSKVLVVYFQSNYIEGVFILTFQTFKLICKFHIYILDSDPYSANQELAV